MSNTMTNPSFSPGQGYEDDFVVADSLLEDILPGKSFQRQGSVSESFKNLFTSDGNHSSIVDFASLLPKDCHDDICGV
jgi:hypothetical protein